mmetsp:Transcript_25996/g.54428  ORF Transcript_25996/g.54428 Transcript_25996/m.54428 type:complete len:233 (-) Transcript_25996:81-779(-)
MAGISSAQSNQNAALEQIQQRLAAYEHEIATLRNKRDFHHANAATATIPPPPSYFTMPAPPAYAPPPQQYNPPPHYKQPPPATPYQHPPQSYNNHYHNNDGGRGDRGGRGGGRGNRGNNNERNPVKRHKNNYYCYTHGFDVDHPGTNCTVPKYGHVPHMTAQQVREDTNRGPSKEYWLIPHASRVGIHKHIMPSQAQAQGYNVPRPIRNNNTRRGRNRGNNNGYGGYNNNSG